MTSRPSFYLAQWEAELAGLFRDRPVIVGFKVLAAMTADVAKLRRWGARKPLLIARGIGAGRPPDPGDAEVLVLDVPMTDSMTDEIGAMARLAADPPVEVVRRVGAYDPDREAVWWLPAHTELTELLGRPVLGGRPSAWGRLEDKTTCDALWDASGVARSPMRVVPATDLRPLRAASDEIGGPNGVVWSGDASAGVNGSADCVHWVRSPHDAATAYEQLRPRCRRIRVMPYLDGVPCSIHGYVLDDGVAVFRPVELAVLRSAGEGRFVFAGLSTWWDPPALVREQMRTVARRTGALLADRVGYRGAFNIDGVSTTDGFRPTELNPRFTVALATLVPNLPLELVHANVVAGRSAGISADDLERLVVNAADSDRRAYPIANCRRRLDDLVTARIREGVVVARPAVTSGSIVGFAPADGVLRPGRRIAELLAGVLRFADRQWGCDFGELSVAPDAYPDAEAG
ncbi:MAG TPA: hypothetical protein VFR22_15620 [Nocardioidaceae bacterium]|nr:hypothetical protein [Nocardioidaceae bacterium]